MRYSSTLRPCWRHAAATLRTPSTNRLPHSLAVPPGNRSLMTTFSRSVPTIERATSAPRLPAIVKAVRFPVWPTQSHAFSFASDHDVSSMCADRAATIAAATSATTGLTWCRSGSGSSPRSAAPRPRHCVVLTSKVSRRLKPDLLNRQAEA